LSAPAESAFGLTLCFCFLFFSILLYNFSTGKANQPFINITVKQLNRVAMKEVSEPSRNFDAVVAD